MISWLKYGLLFITLLFSSTHFASENNTYLLVLGDSLSAAYGMPSQQGWVNLLSQRLANNYPCITVINASVSGDTTQQGRDKLPGLLAKYHPQVIVVELGGNDGLRGISLAATQANLAAILALAENNQAQVLLLAMRLPPNYGPAYNTRFEAVYASLAEQYQQVEYVPFFLAEIGRNPQLMQADGIHPNAQAQPLILDQLWPFINKKLPLCSP